MSLGQCRILYMPVTFADRHDLPITQMEAQTMLREVAAHYAEASFGKLTILPTVTPGITLPHSIAWYEQRDVNVGTNGDMDSRWVAHDHARNEARKLGYDPSEYDIVIMRQTSKLVGNAATNNGRLWLGNNSAQTTAHEIGHILGLNHANAWNTSGTSTAGPGTDEEYSHLFDIMGLYSIPLSQGHFNVAAKSQLGWLPEVAVQTVTKSGTYLIHAMDTGRLDAGKQHALKIVKDAQRTYWGEVRTLFDENPWAAQGMVLAWNFPAGGTGNAHLLDTTPASPFGLEDAPLSVGRTFSDPEGGLHLTVLAVNESPRWAAVRVHMGDFSSNHAPTSTLTASATAVPVGATVTFTVEAADADGDALAYGWQHLGDPAVKIVSPNSPVITRTFTAAGSFVVACTVSDMKGGASTRFTLVTVGGGNGRSVIRGRITNEGQGIGGLAVTANGAHGTITDSDGHYAIPNLAAGNYVVTPLRHGYQFQEQFSNGVTVGPNFQGADFSAEVLPTVTLTASVGSTHENGAVPPGRFLISRTGQAKGDLQVKLNLPQGTAVAGTDYTLSPALVATAPFQAVTIPDGQSTVEVVVTPLQDVVEEGTETVMLELVADYGYVAGNARAIVEIHDDDTARQRVAVKAAVAFLKEGNVLEEAFLFTRTGDVSTGLSVAYLISGSAVAGTDYGVLSGTVMFAPGAAQAGVALQTLDDAVAEDPKEVKVSITESGAVLPVAGAATASIFIVDDDLPVVKVTATDPDATEGSDNGTWVISREGDASQEMRVHYALSGQAFHGEDYQALPGSVTLAAGVSEAAITLVPVADGWGEGDEPVELRLAAAPERYSLGDPSAATVVIHDAAADKPTVGVMPALPMAEPATHGRFILMAAGTGVGSVTVHYEMSGTAVAGSDYAISGLNTMTRRGSVTLTLPADGRVQSNLAVSMMDDILPEDLESVTISLLEDAAYQISALNPAGTLWITDNERPTVYVDAQVGTNRTVGETVYESSATPVALYFSRTGSTAASLQVAYTVGGTASNGADYGFLSGTVTIPAGSEGVVQAVSLINDILAEGTETLEVSVTGGSAYSAGPMAVVWITDDEAIPQFVTFGTESSLVDEDAGTVQIPVSLSAPATTATRVEYAADSPATGSATTSATLDLPHWVRVVRDGTSFTFYNSTDGVIWSAPLRAQALPNSMSANPYFAGVCVGSGVSGEACTAVFDNVSITGLEPGGTVTGGSTEVVGSPSPLGSSSLTNGVYTVAGGGPGLAVFDTTAADALRYVHFSVANSTTCTLTARVVSMNGGNAAAKAGVMFRDSLQGTGRQVSLTAVSSGGSAYNYRSSVDGNSNGLVRPALLRPFWVAVQRQGNVVSTLRSNDGTVWIPTTSSLYNNLPSRILAGLAVSSKSSSSLSTAVFDQVSLTGGDGLLLANSSIGATNAGSYSTVGDMHTLSGGGTGITATSDSFGFASQEIEGDFFLKARLLSQTGGTSTSQAGVMLREATSQTSLMAYLGGAGSGSTVPSFGGFARSGAGSTAIGNGIDYTLAPGALDFAVGEQVKNISVNIHEDELIELPESFAIALKNPFAAMLGTASKHTVTINDNDAAPAMPSVGFAASSSAVNEGDGMAAVQVVLSQASAVQVTVSYAVTGGTATAGADWTVAGSILVFQPGETVKTILVNVVNDTALEADETVLLSLSAPGAATLGSLTQHTLTLLDDDLPVVNVVATDAQASEAGDAGKFTLTRSGTTAGSLDVNVAITGTAVNGTDYAVLPSVVTFPVGQAEAVILVAPIQDSLNEGTETVVLAVQADAAYRTGPAAEAEVSITDDDRSSVSLIASDGFAGEGGDPGQFMVMRSAPLTGTLQVNLSFTGTAVNGMDYQMLPGTVLLADGQSSVTLNVLPVEDLLAEGAEEVVATVLAGDYEVATNAASAVVRIEDNDQAPVVRIISPSARGQIISNGNGIIVEGVVADDGLPQQVTTLWSKVSGPGEVIFDDSTALRTGAGFTVAGVYVLRLTANDGHFTASAEVTVEVDNDSAADWLLRNIGTVTSPAPAVSVTGGTVSLSGAGALDIAIVDPAYDSPSRGAFYARSYVGDFDATVRHGTATSSATRARSGLMLRATVDSNSAYAHIGRVPQSAYDGFLWRTTTGGLKDGVAGYAGTERWLRLVRRGNSVTAFHAPDVSGAPGAWIQTGPPQTVVLPDKILIGLFVDNNLGSGLNTVSFTHLGITPLNRAPVVQIDMPAHPAVSPVMMQGSVTDDGLPAPAVLDYLWSQRTGTGTVNFQAAAELATSATLSRQGEYTLRLQADDGGAETFLDRTLNVYRPFEAWLFQHFTGGPDHPDAGPLDDPDKDGLSNLAEYAFGLNPGAASAPSMTVSLATIAGEQYLRLSVQKNPSATGVIYTSEIADTLPGGWMGEETVIEVNTSDLFQARDTLPVSARTRRFLRARLSLEED